MSKNNFFDPFSGLSRSAPFRDLEEWFRDFPLKSAMRESQVEQNIRLDITENEEAYLVQAEVPGVKKEDIKVEIEGRQVSLAVERVQAREEKEGETVVRSERYVGRQFRSFTLPGEVDDSRAQASYQDGILHLNLPKKTPGAGGRQIEVH